jgi:hypothetical protein
VLIEVENGRLFGASDPRRPAGAAVALECVTFASKGFELVDDQ